MPIKCRLAPTFGYRRNGKRKIKELIVKFTTKIVQTAIGAAGTACGRRFRPSNSLGRTAKHAGIRYQRIAGRRANGYRLHGEQPAAQHHSDSRGYTPKGTLYQADITATSDGGTVTPMVRDFSALAAQRSHLQADRQRCGPERRSPAPIPQGSESRGTLYFDVTGAPPMGVAYNDGQQELLIWTSNVRGAWRRRSERKSGTGDDRGITGNTRRSFFLLPRKRLVDIRITRNSKK